MKRVAFALALIFVAATPALAQLPQTDGTPARLNATFAPARVPGAPAHRGLTVLGNIGLGIQKDTFYEMTETGLGGLNFGVGWFLTGRMAVLFRFSGTRVTYPDLDDLTQAAGVFGGTIQYWLNDWASIEGGAGLGRWSDSDGISDNGSGIIIAFHATVWRKGPHHIRAGFEYAPTFTGTTIHNIGLVGGYQFVK